MSIIFTILAPGQPGITAYKYSSDVGKLLIPPAIAGKYKPDISIKCYRFVYATDW